MAQDPASLNFQSFVMSDPKPGQLVQMARERPRGFVLAYYREEAFVEMVQKSRSRATSALVLLDSPWDCLADAPFVPGLLQPPVHAQVGSLVVCRPPVLGRILNSRKDLVSRLAAGFLFITADTKSIKWNPEPNPLLNAALQGWGELIYRVGDVCRAFSKPVLQLSPAAANLLREFWREEMAADSPPAALIGAQYAPLLAAKLVLPLHFCVSGLRDKVSPGVMKEAIGMAHWLVRISVTVKNQVAKVQQELVVRQTAQKMLQLLPEGGMAKWRTISRRLHLQSKPVHQPALDYLLATGQFIQHADDSFERPPTSKQT